MGDRGFRSQCRCLGARRGRGGRLLLGLGRLRLGWEGREKSVVWRVKSLGKTSVKSFAKEKRPDEENGEGVRFGSGDVLFEGMDIVSMLESGGVNSAVSDLAEIFRFGSAGSAEHHSKRISDCS